MATIATTTRHIRTFGCRVARSGEVYAYLEQPSRGRCRESKQLLVGYVRKVASGWQHDATRTVYPTQSDAAVALVRIICPDRCPTCGANPDADGYATAHQHCQAKARAGA